VKVRFFLSCIAAFFFSQVFSASELPSFFPPKAYSPENEWLPPSVQEGLFKLQQKQWNAVVRKQKEQTLFLVGLSFVFGCGAIGIIAFRFFPYKKWQKWQQERKKRKKGEELAFLMKERIKKPFLPDEQSYLWSLRSLLQEWICWKAGLESYSLISSQIALIPEGVLTKKERELIKNLLEKLDPLVFSKEKKGKEEELAFIDKKFTQLIKEVSTPSTEAV